MERRNFLKLSALAGVTATMDACGQPDHQLIRFVPEENLIPGIAVWKPSVCTMCSSGCGLLVRVMEGDAEVVRKGQPGVIPMGLAKKLEGNPEHPVNQGKLCARGQAGIQVNYHPDRLKNPLKRTGPRGTGQFQEIVWEDAIQELVARLSPLISRNQGASISFWTRRLHGQRRILVERFLAALGAPPPLVWEAFDDQVLRKANWLSFGRYQLPTFDLAHSHYVMSLGADFLGTWNSPVAHGLAYGEMRQGRPGLRAKFVQAETRMSQTGANADEWVPVRPGSEGVLALGLAHVILQGVRKRKVAAGRAAGRIEGWANGLPDYAPEAVEKRTGVAATRITRLAEEMAGHAPAVAILGGAPLAHTNGLFTALAVNALNELLGSVETPGGVSFTPAPSLPGLVAVEHGAAPARSLRAVTGQILSGSSPGVHALLLHEADPVFAAPAAWRVREALEKIPFIASFGNFLDETSVLADLILPDHAPLESWLDHVPESGAARAIYSVAAPAVQPLHNTRAMPDVVLETARALGGKVADALPWASYEEMLRFAVAPLRSRAGRDAAAEPDAFWKSVKERGGWWSKEAGAGQRIAAAAAVSGSPARFVEPQFDGDAAQYPYHFLPYVSQQFLEGSLAHLPWLQEMPDVLSTAMWSTWVEIHPQTAKSLGIGQGDLVEVASQYGSVRAPALLSPGIAPEVVAMPAGQGHEHFGRYASGRGANPLQILAPLEEPETGALAWAATRVRISRVGEGRLILFGAELRENPREHERR